MKYKVVALIPVKGRSERVPGKNFKYLGGKPLYEHMIEKALKSNVDAVFVNTDDEQTKIRAKEMGAHVIDRPAYLSTNEANGNHLINYDANIIDADIYIQLFVTAPFLKVETINKAIEILKNNEKYDSVFTVLEEYTWFWFNGKPVNYSPKELPRSQDAQPLIKETTGLYAVRKEVIEQHKCRIGNNPYMLGIDKIEGIDIDDHLDFKYAEMIFKEFEKENNY